MRKMTSYDIFVEFIKEYGRYPTVREFEDMGYCKRTYYRCKQAYKPTEPEEGGYYERTGVEVYPNGISIVNLKLKGE